MMARRVWISASTVVSIDGWNWLDLPLHAPLSAGEVRFILESPTFVPAELVGNADTRPLGVGVRELQVCA